MTDDDLLLVGRVARAHGNRGEVIVNPETDFAEQRFTPGAVLFVGSGADAVARTIAAVRFHQGRPIIALDGVETMNDAEALAGVDLRMHTSSLEPLPEGTFYRHDLVGCEVRDVQDALIGIVAAVEGSIDRSHLLVTRPRGGDVLIPLVADICERVDLAAKRIVVNPPAGLIELNEPGRQNEP